MNETHIKQIINERGLILANTKPISQDIKNILCERKQRMTEHMKGLEPSYVKEVHYLETKAQQEYRNKVYRSITQGMLLKAMNNVYRILESKEFSVSYDETIQEALSKTFCFGDNVQEIGISQLVFNVLFPLRVKDPSAVLCVVPILDSNKQLLRLELEVYPCENVILYENELVILNAGNNTYKVYTKNFYGTYEITENDTVALKDYGYPHKNNNIGCCRLGGVSTYDEFEIGKSLVNDSVKKIYKLLDSDYAYALPTMDMLAQASSQSVIVISGQVYPKWAQYEIECSECEGKGHNELYEEGALTATKHSCNKCDGRGTLKMGAQDIFVIPYREGNFLDNGNATPDRILPNQIGAYLTPEIASADFLYKVMQDLKTELKNILQINYNENANDQSGYAKELDMTSQHTEVKKISTGLKGLIESTLKMILAFYIQEFERKTSKQSIYNAAYESIIVSMPLRIDLATLSDKEKEYFDNIEKKTLQERKNAWLSILKKRDEPEINIRAFEISCLYTNCYCLYQVNELRQLTIIDNELQLKATAIFGVVDEIIQDIDNVAFAANMSNEDWINRIDEKFKPLLEKLQNVSAPFSNLYEENVNG